LVRAAVVAIRNTIAVAVAIHAVRHTIMVTVSAMDTMVAAIPVRRLVRNAAG
jgi:hypothetical protein